MIFYFISSFRLHLYLESFWIIITYKFQVQKYKFRLNENPKYGWQPRVSSKDFISILANLTAFKIRGTYTPLGKMKNSRFYVQI